MAWRAARYRVGSLGGLGLAAGGHHWRAERGAWRHEAELACLKSGQVKESASVIRIEPINGPGVCGADFPLKVSAIGEGAPIGFDEEMRPPGAIPGGPRQPLANAPYPAYSPRVSAPAYEPYPAPQVSQGYPTQGYPSQAQQYPSQYPQQPYAQPQYSQQPYPQQAYPSQPYPQQAAAPMRLSPPGVAPVEPEAADEEGPDDQADQSPSSAPYRPATAPTYAQPYPQQSAQPPQQPYPPATPVPLGRESASVTTGSVTVKPTATLACPIVSQLDNWFANGVQPAAMKWFGVP